MVDNKKIAKALKVKLVNARLTIIKELGTTLRGEGGGGDRRVVRLIVKKNAELHRVTSNIK